MADKRPPPRKPSLAPETVVAQLASGADAAKAFAGLGLNQCQLHETVDTANYTGPAIPMEGFGRVAKGRLVLTQATKDSYHNKGIPFVCAITRKTADNGLSPNQVAIFDDSERSKLLFSRPDHFAEGIETSGMTWLRNAAITHTSDTAISINGTELKEGDDITLDSHRKVLYAADLPVCPIPESTSTLNIEAKNARPDFKVLANTIGEPSVAAAMHSTADGIGLHRPENGIRHGLLALGNNYHITDNTDRQELIDITSANLAGNIYSKQYVRDMLEDLRGNSKTGTLEREHLEHEVGKAIRSDLFDSLFYSSSEDTPALKNYPVTFRLYDLDIFRKEAEETKPISIEEKRRFYALQADLLFQTAKTHEKQTLIKLSVLVPSVHSAHELADIKSDIEAAAKKHGFIDPAGKHQFRFGAMIENKDAAAPKEAAAIAKMVDFVSFGTNDLTRDVTNVERNGVDREEAKRWMKEHSYTHLGESPFDVLVPPVTRKMDLAVQAMRKANPAIKVGCCGRQVAAHAPSIKAVIDMGLDNISVPAQDVAASRIIAAHFSARKELERSASR